MDNMGILNINFNDQQKTKNRNLHSHMQERYNANINSKIWKYSARLYYINTSDWEHSYLCSSDSQGNNIKIITDLGKSYFHSYIFVNYTGIYIYRTGESDKLIVLHLWFDGKCISECCQEGDCEDGEQISNIYFYDNCVYFVYTNDFKNICQIRRMFIDEKRIDTIYEKATYIHRLYATKTKIFFLAEYENYDISSGKVWMILDISRKNIECLSNPYCNPEDVIYNPDVYDEESPRYNEKCNYNRNITFIDLDRDIFWSKQTCNEGQEGCIDYWQPHRLWGNRDVVIDNMPIWKMVDLPDFFDREYFDGTYHYYTNHYTKLISSDIFGNKYNLSPIGNSHGECDKFEMHSDCLYVDMTASKQKQYKLGIERCIPVRDTWFNDKLDKDVIELYYNSKKPPKKETHYTINPDLYIEKTIGNTDIKYNIITLGAKFHIGFNEAVTICIENNKYELKTHKTVKGRIDGLKKLYTENNILFGDVLKVTYYKDNNIIYLEK